MQIKVSNNIDGSLAPKAWGAICSVPESFWFNIEHGRRHPVSIYSGSIRSITKQWTKTTNALDKLRLEHDWAHTENSYDQVLDNYRDLLYRLNEHHDACLGVLRSLCPASLVAKSPKLDQQFLLNAKIGAAKQFLAHTEEYRDHHLGTLVNTLKHNQGELSSIFISSSLDFRPGYFLRDVLPDSSLGPSKELHNNGHTAFSFSRDLMMHLWWLYRIGDLLAIAIAESLQSIHGKTLEVARHSLDDENLVAALAATAKLDLRFFPDECYKPYPRILLAAGTEKLTLQFPTMAHGNKLDKWSVRAAFKIDKSHPSNRLPYFGSDFEAWFKDFKRGK